MLTDAAHDGGDVGLGLRERDTGLQAADYAEVVIFAVGAEFAFPVGGCAEDFRNRIDGIDPELDVAAVAEAGGKDADELYGLIVEADGFADDGVVAAEMALPEPVGQDGDARGAEGSFCG